MTVIGKLSAYAARSCFALCLVSLAILLLPVNSVFAYDQTLRDETSDVFYGSNPGWAYVTGQDNGYDDNTEVDCIDQLDNCRTSANSDYAMIYPYPNPSPYWMCPFTHIAEYSGWSSNQAEYDVHDGNGHDTFSFMTQSYYLDAWFILPNVNFSEAGYVKVLNEGGGTGSISVDMTTFHYDPYDPYDTACS